MLTDDDVRDAFHARLGPELTEIVPRPGLLHDVRRRRVRQRYVGAAAAPVVVAVLAAAVAIAARGVGSGPAATVTRDSVVASAGTPTPAPPGPTVSLFDYRFTLPSGFVVGHRSGVVDLATADPHAGIGGYTDSFSARDPATGRGLQATVYRGPIAAAERQVEYPVPGEVHETTVAGHPTSVDPFGTDRECVWRDVTPASPRPGEESTIRGTCADGKWVEGRKGSIEARVHVSAREEILVHAVDIPEAELLALLEAALQGS